MDKPQDIRLIFSEKHNMILRLLIERDLSISDIAKILSLNPGSVHYHLKELEKHGLVKQVREEVKRGIVKKYYRSAAKRIVIDSPNFNLEKLPGLYHQGVYRPAHRVDRVSRLSAASRKPGGCRGADCRDMISRQRRLLVELHNTGLENVENDGVVLQNAYNLIFNIGRKKTRNGQDL